MASKNPDYKIEDDKRPLDIETKRLIAAGAIVDNYDENGVPAGCLNNPVTGRTLLDDVNEIREGMGLPPYRSEREMRNISGTASSQNNRNRG